jgi:hypothetical protein
MMGLLNISQLYQKFFDPPGEMPITDLMSVLKDNTNPDFSTAEAGTREEQSPSEAISERQSNKDRIDRSASLEEVIALTSANHIPPPTSAPTAPNDRLQALIRANRYPPGQRVIFAAIDALSPELKRRDAILGLKMALRLLYGALENALDDPTVIQQHSHVRMKLMAEYLALPTSEQVDGIGMDVLIEGIKSRVASRWRVEAMEKQRQLL